MYLKKLHIDFSELCMFLLVGAATFYRFMLIRLNWPTTNSDESTMGLMALHIAYRGEHPIFFYGQGYMGSLQAYMGAILFHVFGASMFTLRLGLLVLFAGYLVCMYYMTSMLYTKKFALVTVAFLSLGSSAAITPQLFANGGYAETMLFGSLIFLLTSWLLLTAPLPGQQLAAQERRGRLLAYGLLGLVMGLALWSDTLILPCIATAGTLLALFCRRELRSWASVCLCTCLLIGLLPLIIYNIQAAATGQDTLHAVVGAASYTASRDNISLLQQLGEVLLISIPFATGANPLCWVDEPVYPVKNAGALFASDHPLQCVALQGGWSLGVLMLWAIAVAMVLLPLWRQGQRVSAKDWSFEERQNGRRQALRLMLLVSVALWVILYAASSPAVLHPRSTTRYLVCLLLATPAVLWPLWSGIGTLKDITRIAAIRTKAALMLRPGLLLLLAFVAVRGSIETVSMIPAAQDQYAQQTALIHDLSRIGATRFYSDYWTCSRLILQSQERLICSSLDEQFQPGLDRYLPYRAVVRATASPAYVFSLNSVWDNAIKGGQYVLDKQYQRYVFDGYVVYAKG